MNKSSKLTEADVIHVAKLAKLALTTTEVKKFQRQLSDILEYFEVLDQIPTKNLEYTSQITGVQNVLRQDKINPGFSQKEALSGRKDTQKGLFKVKAIFE